MHAETTYRKGPLRSLVGIALLASFAAWAFHAKELSVAAGVVAVLAVLVETAFRPSASTASQDVLEETPADPTPVVMVRAFEKLPKRTKEPQQPIEPDLFSADMFAEPPMVFDEIFEEPESNVIPQEAQPQETHSTHTNPTPPQPIETPAQPLPIQSRPLRELFEPKPAPQPRNPSLDRLDDDLDGMSFRADEDDWASAEQHVNA